MSVLHQDAVIANGASTSGELDITDRVVLAVEIPSSWTAANITITAAQKSTADGGTYVPIKNQDGTDIVLVAAASTVIVISPLLTLGCRWITLRSGVPGTYVNQAAARTLSLVTCEDDRV